MYVPDDAKKRRHLDRVTPSEWQVYEAHCERRMAKTGLSDATNEWIAAHEHLALKTVQNAMSRLRKLGWLRDEAGGVRLTVGDFSPVDKKHGHPSQPSLFRPQAVPEQPPEPAPDTGKNVPHTGKDVPPTGSELPHMGKNLPYTGNGAYIGSRARDNQPDQQNQPLSHTHLNSHPARAREDGVCVSIGKSKFSKPELRLYAEAKGLGEGWVTVAWRGGEWDADVGDYLARREQALDGRPPAGEAGTPYHVAARAVASVASVAGNDVAGFIEQYPNVSEETRARLRSTFLGARGGARARAP